MAASGEGFGDRCMDDEEASRRTSGAEALHVALESPDRHLRTLSPIVLALASDMPAGQAEIMDRRRVGTEARPL